MKRYLAVIFVLICLFLLASCSREPAILGESKRYEVTSGIHSLDIRINAADFIIEHGDRFCVESNLKDLSVSEIGGVLTVIDKTKPTADYSHATVKLYLPDDMVFEDIDIATGAGTLTSDSLAANSLELDLGAGKAQFQHLTAYFNADIESGAGEVSISGGSLNNLSLELGVGRLNMTTALLGKNDLEFGVGEANVTLIGTADDYKLAVEKGIGIITIDGKPASALESFGNGQCYVNIEGGVGAINITFQENE